MKAIILTATALFAAVLSVSTALAGEFAIKPSVTLIEEYNDNIFLSDTDRREEYITRVLPSVALNYSSPLWTWDLSYAFDYRYYALDTVKDDSTHKAAAYGDIDIVENTLFLHLSDSFERVSLDNTRDATSESLFLNQSDRNTYEINPYFTLRPASLLTVNLGYRRTGIWYDDPAGVDKTDDIAYADAFLELSPRLTLNSGYSFLKEDSSLKDYLKHDIFAGAEYEYAPASNIHIKAGASWLDFEDGRSFTSFSGGAGIAHDFDPFILLLDASIDVAENPLSTPEWTEAYTLAFLRKIERGSLKLSFNLTDYRGLESRSLRTRVYGAGATLSYGLAPRLAASLSLTAEKRENRELDTTTRRFLATPRLSYAFQEGFTLALTYNYAGYHSPETVLDNYENNRFSIEMKKLF